VEIRKSGLHTWGDHLPIFDSTDIPIFRDYVLLMYGAIILYSILFALTLLGQWYNDKYRSLVNLKVSWSVFFIGMAMNSGMFMLSSFWFIEEPVYSYLVTVGYVALTFALTAFFFAMERILPYKTYYGFTILGFLSAIFTIISPYYLYELIALSIAFLALVGIMLFLRFAFRNTIGDVRRNVKFVVGGFLIAWVGFIGRSDYTYYNFGEVPYIIGTMLLVLGSIVFGYALVYSVALDELDWRKHLVDLYVIKEGGLLAYHHEFVKGKIVDQALTAAGMSGVQSLFQEIISTDDGLNIVSIGSSEILFSHGKYITCVLVTKEPYRILLTKVDNFTKRFEKIFWGLLRNVSGSLNDFEAAHELVHEVFYDS
jgi:hypothetical protein